MFSKVADVFNPGGLDIKFIIIIIINPWSGPNNKGGNYYIPSIVMVVWGWHWQVSWECFKLASCNWANAIAGHCTWASTVHFTRGVEVFKSEANSHEIFTQAKQGGSYYTTRRKQIEFPFRSNPIIFPQAMSNYLQCIEIWLHLIKIWISRNGLDYKCLGFDLVDYTNHIQGFTLWQPQIGQLLCS